MNLSNGILKGVLNLFPLFLSALPVILIIIFVLIIIFCLTHKVKIKFRTFKGKGFRPVRGNFGLYTYCGKQGTGKTYSYVEYLLDNSKNITHFGNVADIQGIDYFHFTGFVELIKLKQLIDYNYKDYEDLKNFIFSLFPSENNVRGIKLFDLYVDYLESGKQLVFGYDEIFTELLRGSKLSKDVIDFLCQMRKRGIIFLTTCQEWSELPLPFRKFCRFQIDCRMVPFLNTGFLIKTFKDAENMKWSNDEQEHVAPLVETTITKTRIYIAKSYNTFLRISSITNFSANSFPTSLVENELKQKDINFDIILNDENRVE